MEDTFYKVIVLEDKPINHEVDFPYTDEIPGKPYLFTLRSKKTSRWEPCLIFDQSQGFKPTLPLSPGRSLNEEEVKKNCLILRGDFTKDGQWFCKINNIESGIAKYQLIFTRYGQDKIEDVGESDVLLVRQKKTNIRKYRKQTLFARCIGDWKEWPSFLRKQTSIGYNAFHFAPIQETGSSKSYYSIFDQLELANDIFKGSSQEKYEQLQQILKPFQKEGVVFFVDIVLNHTSFDSDWIKKDPKTVFTTQNTPILHSAYELDRAILNWGNQIKFNFGDSNLEMDQDQFKQLSEEVDKLVKSLKLQEYFLIPTDIKDRFLNSVKTSPPSQNIFAKDPSEIVLQFIQKNAECLGCCRYGINIPDLEEKWIKQQAAYEEEDLVYGIEKFNDKWTKKVKQQWVPQIIQSILGQIKYQYLQSKTRTYGDPYPFVKSYFSTIHCESGQTIQALNNGWVMDADTTVNMVTSNHFYYLRRKVFVWGDLVRIRYGESPEDSPSWDHMKKYIQIMAKHFDGFRLDNLHGTPFLVAQYLMKEARKINPEIIIFAELFTRTEQETAAFTRRIGINSTLIQLKHRLSGESFVRLFHKIMGFSGQYIGSLSPYFEQNDRIVSYLHREHPIRLVYDLTHDNKTYQQDEQTIVKTPICLMLDLTGAFVGSTKGFDQFYSKKIQVTEQSHLYLQDESVAPKTEKKILKRKIVFECEHEDDKVEIYGSWNSWQKSFPLEKKGTKRQIVLQLKEGRHEYKFLVNNKDWKSDLKKKCNYSGNHQIDLQGEHNVTFYSNLEGLRKIAAHYRQKYANYRQYYAYRDGNIVFLLRQSKQHENSIFIIANISTEASILNSNIELPGTITSSDIWHQSQFDLYQGLSISVQILNHKNLLEYFDIHHDATLEKDILVSGSIPAGFACLIECTKTKEAIQNIRGMKQLKNLQFRLPPLGTLDYNTIMFGASQEEQQKFKISNYVIPGKKLVYGGFGGIFKEIKNAKKWNNLSSSLFDNLREGNWLLDYYVSRLKKTKNLSEVADIIQRNFECIKKLPAYLKPKYFSTFIYKFCKELQRSLKQSSSSDFEKRLLLASTQYFCKFQNPNPIFNVTMSAGLPFFCVGTMRSWGRDTFTCNELLLYHPNIYRDIIHQFASTMRHGTIPNLLDFGQNPRYNCRDACWWFIRGICEYVKKTKDFSILKMKVNMIFLSDDIRQNKEKKERGQTKILTLEDIIHQIIQSHSDGISYREWHAGYELDVDMSAEGFNVKLLVDDETGFIYNENIHNCQTWMDKMGSSARANNKGHPATPRTGSPIELTALLYACLTQLIQLNQQGHYKYSSVQFIKRKVTYTQWAETIMFNFQKNYYIPVDAHEDGAKYFGIYKDTVNNPINSFYQTFRFRPNVLIAMTVAPKLFIRQHALQCIKNVEQHLINQNSIGVSTLGSRHLTLYSPYYNNSQDSSQYKTAHGFSYHNGPQWVWLYGFYVAAKCIFNEELKKEQLLGLLQLHAKYIDDNQWMGLPQLTNLNGQYNQYSCLTQAWSVSSMILALQHIQKYGK